MGNQAQSHTKSTKIMHNYTFIKQLSQGKNLYKHNHTKKQFITVERTFPNQQTISQYEQKMLPFLSVKHPYFLNQTQHAMTATSMLCSMQYRVVHFFQYQPHTLEQELQTRKKHERYFEQKEIWSILCSSVLAMAHLTKNDIQFYSLHPRDIVIDKIGMIKILSPLLTNQNHHQLIDPALYYSPQHLKAIKSQNITNLSNKSSVFTLGISLLHILSLEPMNQLYNYENCTINVDLLNQLIDKISQSQIKEVIKKMVKYHGYDRITFTELEEMLYDVLEGENEQEQHQAICANQIEQQNHSRLEQSIHKLHQVDLQQKQSLLTVYQTGSASYRQHNSTQKVPTIASTLKPLNNDSQNISNTPSYESGIDTQNIDEEDASQKQQQQTGRNKLRQSQFTHATNAMHDSKLYQTNDSKTIRNALQQISSSHNVTLANPLNQSKQSSHTKTFTNHSSQQIQSNKPYHVREQLKRGTYQGYKLNGMRHGYGVFYYAEGGKYAGEWIKNKMEGRGALYYANEQIAYEGEWQNDKLHGYGILYNQIPTYISQPIDYKTLHLVDNCWIKYQGNFCEDEKNGQGTLFMSNGEYYRGYFKNDLPHGNGIYKCMNSNIIKGNWILGMMQ